MIIEHYENEAGDACDRCNHRRARFADLYRVLCKPCAESAHGTAAVYTAIREANQRRHSSAEAIGEGGQATLFDDP
jgi:hypothetical protein